MKAYFKEKSILILVMIGFYFVIESIAFLWIGFPLFAEDFLIDLIFITLIASVILVIPSHFWSIIYMSIWLLFVNGLFVTNANTFSGYFELFSLEQFKLIGEATDILNLDYINFMSFLVFFILTISYVIVVRRLYTRYLTPQEKPLFKHYLNAFSVFVLIGFSLLTVFSNQNLEYFEQFNEDETLPTLRRESMKNYGLLAYYFKEADLLYFDEDETDPFTLPVDVSEGSPYHGLLEGYNVFTIMIESGESYTIDPILTPNLYQLTQDGLYFPNNYSENKTNVSEIIGMLGHYPPQHFDPVEYSYDFPTSVAKTLNETYHTVYFHDNYDVFYSRGDLLSMIGFESLYFHEDLYPGVPRWEWDGNLTLDSMTASRIIDVLNANDEPFYYFWTTLLGHGPYNEGLTNIQSFEDLGYYDLIEEAESNGTWVNPLQGQDQEDMDRMKYFQATMMDLDVAVGMLMDALEAKGQLDNTLFVFYGDHTAYYHKFNHKVLTDSGDSLPYYNMDLYTSYYMIYNQRLTHAYLQDHESNHIDKFTSPYTIVPTILDLLGESYNQHLMIGDTVFSDLEHVFYSNKLTTFFTDQLFSDNGFDIIYQKHYVGDYYLEEFRYQSQIIIDKLQLINEYYQSTRQAREN